MALSMLIVQCLIARPLLQEASVGSTKAVVLVGRMYHTIERTDRQGYVNC
jgi:hypothetical protein